MEKTNLDTWEYWEEKFKGMTEEEIEAYWVKEMEEANDESIGLIMDAADDLPYGTRAKWVREEYEKYKKAKEQHDSEERIKNSEEER